MVGRTPTTKLRAVGHDVSRFLPLWLRLVGALATPHLNISVEHA
jgi:hypothetical protein